MPEEIVNSKYMRKGEKGNMLKRHWLLRDGWAVENKYRVIFSDLGSHLIDITIENRNVDKIIAEVVNGLWTAEELIEHLNKMTVSA